MTLSPRFQETKENRYYRKEAQDYRGLEPSRHRTIYVSRIPFSRIFLQHGQRRLLDLPSIEFGPLTLAQLELLGRAHCGLRMAMPSSRNWRSGTEDGASHIKSVPRAVFGKGITSRIEVSPARIITSRSRPSAMPPCGGAPYSSASSRKPKRRRASSSLKPRAANTFVCTSRRWIRIEPEPSSTPFKTRSYDFARQCAGSVSSLSRSPSCTDVNG